MKVPRITKEELKAKLDRGEDILIIDVRNETDYGKSNVKIPGAIRVTVDELDFRADEFDRNHEVVTYCT